MKLAHVNIGTNLGDRAELIGRAVGLLGEEVGRVCAVSTPVESEAWGYESPNRYLNVGVNVATELDAELLVGRLQTIERSIDPAGVHRDAAGGYADRMIDLDLICLDGETVDSPTATVPHPRMHLRPFVLAPMAEILPQWRHPRQGLTAAELLAKTCNNIGGKNVEIRKHDPKSMLNQI